jgi:hypothetical protein
MCVYCVYCCEIVRSYLLHITALLELEAQAFRYTRNNICMWPIKSSLIWDMSLMSIFGMLWIKHVRQHASVPASIQQPHTAIEEERDNIPQATINRLISSMWRICVALHVENDHTRYRLVFWSIPLLFLRYCIYDQQMHICIPSHWKFID